MKRYLSLRMRVFLIFFGVVILIVGIFFLMNRVFWGNIYIRENRNALLSTYAELKTMIADENTTEEDLQNDVYPGYHGKAGDVVYDYET